MKLLINWNFLTVAGPSDRVGELVVADVRTHLLDYIARVFIFFPPAFTCFILKLVKWVYCM
jgi:hypothetical protein